MKRWVDSLRQSLQAEQRPWLSAATPPAPASAPEELDWPSIDDLLEQGLLPESDRSSSPDRGPGGR